MAIESQTLCFLSLGELSALLRKREITSVETTRAVLDRTQAEPDYPRVPDGLG
jgi:Asp-tRNA(Asn)/Glu-tRNA(Gln) amidotransferase A subunit family amidase